MYICQTVRIPLTHLLNYKFNKLSGPVLPIPDKGSYQEFYQESVKRANSLF